MQKIRMVMCVFSHDLKIWDAHDGSNLLKGFARLSHPRSRRMTKRVRRGLAEFYRALQKCLTPLGADWELASLLKEAAPNTPTGILESSLDVQQSASLRSRMLDEVGGARLRFRFQQSLAKIVCHRHFCTPLRRLLSRPRVQENSATFEVDLASPPLSIQDCPFSCRCCEAEFDKELEMFAAAFIYQ
jgi:hypothetical protein